MTEVRDHSGLAGTPVHSFRPDTVAALADFLRTHPEGALRIGAGNTGVSGGAVPLAHETYIDCRGLRAIRWSDAAAGVVYAEAGVTMAALKDFVEAAGWFFPVLPGSLEKATLGGMLACNGGGPYSLRYGKMGHFTLGVEVVATHGEVYFLGSKCKKVSEGPPLHQLLIGSEGSLGVITGAYLQCISPLPPMVLTRIAHPSFWELLKVIPKLLPQRPLFLEMAEEAALAFSSGVEEAVIWMGSEVAPQLQLPEPFGIRYDGLEGLTERFTIGHRLQTYKPFVDLDVSFPVGESQAVLKAIKTVLEAAGLEHVFFGHAGDGNWHIHVFYAERTAALDGAIAQIDSILAEFEGHLSGEHGIGRVHRERFRPRLSAIQRRLYAALKSELDPKGRLDSLM